MTSKEVRSGFLDFFKSKGHNIVSSAPIVVKNDPTLMFTNAGMNQFKDYFLGNKTAANPRVADTQKCLRVSGKHNDLEEVGVDTYHHTMFEMLGNWSFGDYFKKDAIDWAWELLTEVYKLDKTRLYVTVFEGDPSDNLSVDQESVELWKNHIDADRILLCSKKDNFWEMGETGPCGSCSEIHIDLRPESERKSLDGKGLVNMDHPQVIELWNLVFMEFNRKADGSLENLPDKHVDTGMGLERVVRAIKLQTSNYDTDIFHETIQQLEQLCAKPYGQSEEIDVAFRVISDHLRALAFCIADGQLPSNTGAGYVLRRILRRAVRYGYSFLGFSKPFMTDLINPLATKFADVFPELEAQKDFVAKVVKHEEASFFKTLRSGLDRLDAVMEQEGSSEIDGQVAFELYDTFGFPPDLTMLIATENGLTFDERGFNAALQTQKQRSKADASKETGDWIIVREDDVEEFIGYDYTEAKISIRRYRTLKLKGKEQFQMVFNLTPFYAESGGQVGDTGSLTGDGDLEKIMVVDTQKENDLIVHLVNKFPKNVDQPFQALVHLEKRNRTTYNHSATHLLQAALKQVLGDHVSQKGSLVDPDKLRFDFTHFAKMTDEELKEVERIVNQKVRTSISLKEERNVPYNVAIKKGVTALFGEKYGDVVRVITFDEKFSTELCGGCHVQNTSEIGMFKIASETSIAAGVRRIEALTNSMADEYVNARLRELVDIEHALGANKPALVLVEELLQQTKVLRKEVEHLQTNALGAEREILRKKVITLSGVNAIISEIAVSSTAQAKDLAFQLKNDFESFIGILTTSAGEKPGITIIISENLVKLHGWNAGNLVREWGKLIKGGGGGQPFFAQAGGNDLSGCSAVIHAAETWLKNELSK
ncbi:MAG: alanyl-tRNA synthetase [Bacteroidia bacterium]|jgi:alanyl-tRNA synthetase